MICPIPSHSSLPWRYPDAEEKKERPSVHHLALLAKQSSSLFQPSRIFPDRLQGYFLLASLLALRAETKVFLPRSMSQPSRAFRFDLLCSFSYSSANVAFVRAIF